MARLNARETERVMIKQRTMGRTGRNLSELSLGTLNFGWKTDEAAAHAILDAYYNAGGNFIQAANWSPQHLLPSLAVYRSEEMVGRWWTTRRIPRHELFLATRVYVRQPARGEISFIQVVREALQDSLRRLRTSYLDMVIFEWNDGLVPINLTLEVFDLAVRSGAARYIGAANFPAWRVSDALSRAYLANHNRMEALQADYSLMTRARFEPEARALCQEQRLGFFATSPLAGGFLARGGAVETMLHAARRDRLMVQYGDSYRRAAQSAVAEVAARHAVSSARVALAWVLHNPAVTSAVIGVHSVTQLNDLARAGSLTLSGADIELLDQATALEEIRLSSDFTRARTVQGELMLN
jgi:aryl-alcohol dehydrogenase-like predicted oxidoreductase